MTRMLSAVVFLSLLVALVVAAWHARAGATAAQVAQAERVSLQRQAQAAESQMANLRARERYQERALSLLQDADAQGFQASAWSQRRLEFSRRELSRREAIQRMESIAGGRFSVFAPQGYELSVRSPDHGLFHVPVDDRSSVFVSLSGVEYLRLGGER